MANFDDLNAALDAASAKLDAVKKDTDSLLAEITRLQQNPPTGMTADQQSALDTAVLKAQAIRDGLGALDGLVPDSTTAPTSSDTASTGATEPTAPTTPPPNELNPAPAQTDATQPPADATAAPETPPAAPAA